MDHRVEDAQVTANRDFSVPSDLTGSRLNVLLFLNEKNTLKGKYCLEDLLWQEDSRKRHVCKLRVGQAPCKLQETHPGSMEGEWVRRMGSPSQDSFPGTEGNQKSYSKQWHRIQKYLA